jgi:hypothetical protein
MSLTHGIDVNNNLVPLLLDPSGKVLIYGTLQVQLVAGAAVIGHVIVDTAPVTQVQSTQADKIFSYLAPLIGTTGPINLAAGVNTLTIYTVPANRVGHVTMITGQYNGTITNVVLAPQFVIGGKNIYVGYTKPIVSGTWYTWIVYGTLAAGDAVNLVIVGATLNDTAYTATCGSLMHDT